MRGRRATEQTNKSGADPDSHRLRVYSRAEGMVARN